MKKVTKVVLALVLCLACLALTACSKSDDKKLVGTWETPVDLTSTMMGDDEDAEAVKQYFPNGLSITVAFTFGDDKSASMTVTDESLNSFKSTMVDGLKAQMADMLGDNADEVIQSMGYDSVDAYVEEIANESFDVTELKDKISKKGKFELKDGKLFIYEETLNENDYIKYEFVNDKELKFTEITSASNMEVPFELPMTLKKK